jgi:midasin (ATPase involved in ribosome maturation)
MSKIKSEWQNELKNRRKGKKRQRRKELLIRKWDKQHIFVKKFSGFARSLFCKKRDRAKFFMNFIRYVGILQENKNVQIYLFNGTF